MNTIHCRIAGCDSKFETTEAVAANAIFLCSKHPRSAQVEAVGRKYDPVKDEKDGELSFQNYQFDPAIDRNYSGRTTPEGNIEANYCPNMDGKDMTATSE